MMDDEHKTIGDVRPYNRAESQAHAALDERRYEYIIERRDALEDKIRFGALSLNAASLVALLAAVGGDGGAAKWLGFDAHTALISACGFAIGAVCAIISVMIDLSTQQENAGDASVRYSKARIWANTHNQEITLSSLEANEKAMREYHEAPLVDFKYSVVGIWFRSMSGGIWLGSIFYPLAKAVLP